jgi:aminoglycoside 3-N-acetyltransferase
VVAVTQAEPATLARSQLARDFTRLGLAPGQDLIVHCSLRRMGWVPGGAETVLAALREAAGPHATIVVPTQTAGNSTTSRAYHAAVAGMNTAQRGDYERAMPGFDPKSSASHGMGRLAEFIRVQPDAVRSNHPQASFTALGPAADRLMKVHDLDCHLGERSPLAALYDGAAILLLGVGYEACTALHLAEYRLPWTLRAKRYQCYVMAGGRRRKVEFDGADLDDSDFPALGRALDDQPFVTVGEVGSATARLLPMRNAVDYAIGWMADHRGQPTY